MTVVVKHAKRVSSNSRCLSSTLTLNFNRTLSKIIFSNSFKYLFYASIKILIGIMRYCVKMFISRMLLTSFHFRVPRDILYAISCLRRFSLYRCTRDGITCSGRNYTQARISKQIKWERQIFLVSSATKMKKLTNKQDNFGLGISANKGNLLNRFLKIVVFLTRNAFHLLSIRCIYTCQKVAMGIGNVETQNVRSYSSMYL